MPAFYLSENGEFGKVPATHFNLKQTHIQYKWFSRKLSQSFVILFLSMLSSRYDRHQSYTSPHRYYIQLFHAYILQIYPMEKCGMIFIRYAIRNWNEGLNILYAMVCFEIWTKVPLHSEYYILYIYKRNKFSLRICNVISVFERKTFKSKLKLCFILLYRIKSFFMMKKNLISYEIVCYSNVWFFMTCYALI